MNIDNNKFKKSILKKCFYFCLFILINMLKLLSSLLNVYIFNTKSRNTLMQSPMIAISSTAAVFRSLSPHPRPFSPLDGCREMKESWRGGSQLLFKLLPALLFSFNVLARQQPNIFHNFHFKAKLAASQFSIPWPQKLKPVPFLDPVLDRNPSRPSTIVHENRRQISFTMKFKILSIFSQLQLDGRDCDLWLPSFS